MQPEAVACGANACHQRDAGAAVGVVLANGIGLHGVGVKHDTVAEVYGGNLAESGDQVCLIVGAEAQQVSVPCWPVRGVVPECKEQRALEQEPVGMWGRVTRASRRSSAKRFSSRL